MVYKIFIAVIVLVGLGAGVYFVSSTVAVDTVSTPQEILSESISSTSVVLLETVSVKEFATYIEGYDVTRIDVRTSEEFVVGHIENSFNIDFYAEDFTEQLEVLDHNASYAIYCHSGNRSGQTLAIMREQGFTDVVNLDGGIVAWTSVGQKLCVEC
jgi:rhodanese-related sulfurtransferase